MAKDKNTTISQVKVNNKDLTAVTKVVELVVVDNQLVPDFREANPGVINSKLP